MTDKVRTPKEIYAEFARTWNAMDVDANSALIHPDNKYHHLYKEVLNKEQTHKLHQESMAALASTKYEILDMIEEGDKVAARSMLTNTFKDGTVMKLMIHEYDVCKDGMFLEGYACFQLLED